MKFIDAGPSLTGAIVRPLWGKVPGIHRATSLANGLFLKLGATPVRPARVSSGATLLVDLRSIGQWYTFYTQKADPFWINLCAELLGDDELFLDIGANIGIYSVQVAAMKRIEGQCHAFEPMPANLARCRENIALNGLERCVTLHGFGLSDEPKTMQLAFVAVWNGEDTGNAEIVSDAPDDGRERFEIEVRRLDDIGLPDSRIGVIKIDIEGHEDAAYAGGFERLSRDRPFIVAEYSRPELASRGLGPELKFDTHLPPDYVAMREDNGRLVPLTDWMALPQLTNFFICPAEKIERARRIGG